MEPISSAAQRWLGALRVVPDEEFERQAREDRAIAARELLDRVPYFLRTPTPKQLFDRIAHEPIKAAARSWDPSGGSLVLLGPTRAGKSSAAAYVFRRLVAVGVRSGGAPWRLAQRLAWFAATDLERARLEHPLGRGEAPDIAWATRAPVLVIDDIGWDRDPSAVSLVLAARYENELPTVATSGLGRAELSEKYGAAVVRRIREAGGAGRVQLVEIT